MGSQSPAGGMQNVHVAICTIEKANSMINRLLDNGNIEDLGAVVVDELHLLGDQNRGYILELLLTKIKYVTSKSDLLIQVIGMSATLPNLETLATWLNAELFITTFRPIPLEEYCLVENKYYDKNGKYILEAKPSNYGVSCNDSVLKICLETIKEGCSVLIFCMTKNRCESLAQLLSSTFCKIGCEGSEFGMILRSQLNSEHILEALEQLKNSPVGLDQVLQKTISFGVGYHHAGLTLDERDIIEGAFKSGAIRVLVATSTLSSGVNLPARKVIIRSPVFQKQPINILSYKQMSGRAGRMGRDTKGESILICSEAEKKIGFNLMMGDLDPVKSCIETKEKYMRSILEIIASNISCSKQELLLYTDCTLLSAQKETLSQNLILEDTLKELENYELIRIQNNHSENHYVATALGKACLSSSMAPNDGLTLFCELQKARQCLVLETDLHLIYLVTPYSVSSQWGNIDWLHLLNLWESLTKAMKKVGELVGVQESFIIKCLRGLNMKHLDSNKLNIHKRFYTALALQDLVNEVHLSEVANKFQCARGFLQGLQQASGTFAGMVTAFCKQLGWKSMEILISQFQDRLHFGIQSELLELMKLSSLNGMRARTLFDAGFETISSIAIADTDAIENVLLKSVPFESAKERENDEKGDIKKRTKIKNIWITGCCGMTMSEAAKNLINEARKCLEQEIGVNEIKWAVKNEYSGNFEPKRTLGSVPNDNKNTCDDKSQNNLNEQFEQIKENRNNFNYQSHQSILSVVTHKSTLKTETDAIIVKKVVTQSFEDNDCADQYVNNNNDLTVSVSSANDTINQKSTLITSSGDIVWDSLNLTETALGNIARLQTPYKIPKSCLSDEDLAATAINNIKNSVISRNTSEKDISLFSSDGDNSSLFEDSLPLDLIPSKLLQDVETPNKREQLEDFYKIKSSNGLEELTESDEVEEMKLVYEEDQVDKTNEVKNSKKDKPLQHFKSPIKRCCETDSIQTVIKQIKVDVKTNINNCRKDWPKLLDTPKLEKFSIKISTNTLNCLILRVYDMLNNFAILENLEEASVYFNFEKCKSANEIIGRRVFNELNITQKGNMCTIKGIAFCFRKTECFYLDLVSLDNKLDIIKDKMKLWFQKTSLKLKMLNLKTINLNLKKWLGVDLNSMCVDVSLMEWLKHSDERIPDVSYLMKKYSGMDLAQLTIKVNNRQTKLKNLTLAQESCVKAWAIEMISEKQQNALYESYQNAINVEIKVLKILSNCELHGIVVDKELVSRLLTDVRDSQDVLQKKAFKICGYHFNFNSSKDVAKVLGIYNGRKTSTRKSVLSSHNTPISSIVMYWRKLNAILTKILYPLTEKACIYSEGDRIMSSYSTFTCTGRITMHEPNLQNVPRTFSIPLRYLTFDNTTNDEVIEFNCRNVFRAAPGSVMVSADYCQLEMRLLTHFSEDSVLTRIMKSDVDVFKSIAASWSDVPEGEVDDDLRQKAKQLCYGIIYGMGNKTLSQHLDVSEMEASLFMDSFERTYPAIRVFTKSVIEECKRQGFVETLSGRRRYLPDITSHITSRRNTAERQAVNTMIQGSAADIAKSAMCSIEDGINSFHPKPRLILQMHDELIYEVHETNKSRFISLMKSVMEDTVELKVPLPVKLKCGYTWGALDEVAL
ncbi:DNA polymerase theta-like isoform X2 [Bombyx mandarina]|nr:DNA polymerase theta-like isoform X2 [Bombyx mandarina]